MQAAQAHSILDALDNKSRRVTTRATPQGEVVWRSWGEGPPLVMLHGGAGSWMHWVRNIEALSQSHELWLPDLPGMGESDLPRDGLDADSIAPIVLDGLVELLKGRSFDIVGFSFGSLVSGYITHLAPEKVNQLILTGGTGLGIHVGPRHELRPLRGVTDEAEREEILRHNLGAIMIHDASHIDALAIAVQDRSAQKDRVRGRKLARSDAMLKIASTWQCPVRGIWGEDDNTRGRNPAAFDAAVEKLGLKEKHVLPGAGHWVQFEQAQKYNALIARMLATH
ncbi:MAG: alpha/beta fold hydrolase [Pseudomonadota bacterium]